MRPDALLADEYGSPQILKRSTIERFPARIGTVLLRFPGIRLMKYYLPLIVLTLIGLPALPAGELTLTPPQLEKPETIVRLPGPIEDVEVGAGGRLLMLHIKSLQQLAVFDVSQAKVSKYIPLPSNDVAIAAGASKLFIGLREERRIKRINLETFKEESATAAPVGGISQLAMGARADAPLFLLSEHSEKKSWVVDPASMKAQPMQWVGWSGGAWGPTDVFVSFDGSTVVAAGGGWAGIEIASIARRRVTSSATGGYTRGGSLLTSGNGSLVFTGDGKILRRDLASEIETIEGTPIPALDANYSLVFRRNVREAWLSVFTNGQPQPLFDIDAIPELRTASALPLHQRIMLIPAAKVLVTVGEDNDHLILRPYDQAKHLKDAGVDYLFVESSPVRLVAKNGRYAYQLAVQSRGGNVKYSLESGPTGMKLSKDGELTWKVPRSFRDESAPVIIQITDDANQTAFHTFTITVE